MKPCLQCDTPTEGTTHDGKRWCGCPPPGVVWLIQLWGGTWQRHPSHIAARWLATDDHWLGRIRLMAWGEGLELERDPADRSARIPHPQPESVT